MHSRADLERFEGLYIPEPNSGCWLWFGATTGNSGKRHRGGYGRFRIGNKTIGAHIFSYQQKYGKVPDGLELDHKCKLRICVNPEHLEPVTRQENVRRGDAGKHLATKTHCPNGHPRTEDNLYRYARYGRKFSWCRECLRAQWRKQNARKAKKCQPLL